MPPRGLGAAPGWHGGQRGDRMADSGTGRLLLAVIAAILVAAALHAARSIAAPVTFAVFAIALVWPLQRRLTGLGLPAALCLLATLAATIAVVGLIGWGGIWGFGRAAHWLVLNAPRFQASYLALAEWLAGQGIYLAELLPATFDAAWLIGLTRRAALQVNGLISFAVVALVFLILGLLEVEATDRRLAALGEHGAAAVVRRASITASARLRRYMAVRAAMSAATGIAVWGFCAALGVVLAAEWGAMAFALNFIPFIGPLVATLLPTLFAFAQTGSPQTAVLVFLGLNVIQFLIGSYMEPRVAGRAVALSPFMVLLAVFLGAFLWGIPGAFLGVPVLIFIVALCESHPGGHAAALLLGGTPPR